MSSRSGGNELAVALALEGRAHPASPEAARLVALAETLATLPDPQIDPKFAARLEARIMEEELAEEQNRALRVVPAPERRPIEAPVRRAKVHPIPRRRVVIRRSLIAAVLASMLFALPLAGSAGALPGSPFYSLKLGIERVELAFAGSPEAKAFKHLEFAGTRLSEATQLVALGHGDAVPGTLDRMAAEQRAGTALILGLPANRPVVAKAATILKRQTGKLTTLATTASLEVRSAVLDALATSKALTTRMTSALSVDRRAVTRVAKAAGAAAGRVLGRGLIARSSLAPASTGQPAVEPSDARGPAAKTPGGVTDGPGSSDGRESYAGGCVAQAVAATASFCGLRIDLAEMLGL